MTKVIFEVGKDTGDGVILNNGSVYCTLTHKRFDGEIVVARSNVVKSFKSEPVSVVLPVTPLGVAVKIVITSHGAETIEGYYKVPDATEIAFRNLIEVDPATLEAGEPDPEWWAVANATVIGGTVNDVGDLILTRNDGVTINAGHVEGQPGKDGVDGEPGPRGLPGRDGYSGVDGIDGLPGVDVESASIDANGFLIITLSNGESFNTGHVVGSDGADGADGANGVDGTNGIDGKDGVGIKFESKLFTDSPLTFSNGVTISNGAIDNGWPVGFLTVITDRQGYGRSVQTMLNVTKSYYALRTEQNGAWTSIREIPFKDYVDNKTWSASAITSDVLDPARIQKVSSVADGLMLKEDKAKLDGLHSIWRTPMLFTALPNAYPLGITVFIIGTSADGWPGTYLQVTTVRSAGGRAVQTMEKVSSSSTATHDFYKRSTEAVDTWGSMKTTTFTDVV